MAPTTTLTTTRAMTHRMLSFLIVVAGGCGRFVAVDEVDVPTSEDDDSGAAGGGAGGAERPTPRALTIEFGGCTRCDLEGVHVVQSDASGKRLGHWLGSPSPIETVAQDGDALTLLHDDDDDRSALSVRVRPGVERVVFTRPDLPHSTCSFDDIAPEAGMEVVIETNFADVLVENDAYRLAGDYGWLGEDGRGTSVLAACAPGEPILLKVSRQVGLNDDPTAFEIREIPYEPGTSRTEFFELDENPRLSMVFDLVALNGATDLRLRYDWWGWVGSSWNYYEFASVTPSVEWEATPIDSGAVRGFASAEVMMSGSSEDGWCGVSRARLEGGSDTFTYDLNDLERLLPTADGGWTSADGVGGPGTVVTIGWYVDEGSGRELLWRTLDDPRAISEPFVFPDLEGLGLPTTAPDLTTATPWLSHQHWRDRPSYAEHVAAPRPASTALAEREAVSCAFLRDE